MTNKIKDIKSGRICKSKHFQLYFFFSTLLNIIEIINGAYNNMYTTLIRITSKKVKDD